MLIPLLALALAGPVASGHCDEVTEALKDGHVKLAFQRLELRQVAFHLHSFTGMKWIMEPGIDKQIRVTVAPMKTDGGERPITFRDGLAALRAILGDLGLTVTPLPDNVCLVSPRKGHAASTGDVSYLVSGGGQVRRLVGR